MSNMFIFHMNMTAPNKLITANMTPFFILIKLYVPMNHQETGGVQLTLLYTYKQVSTCVS